MRFVRKFGRLGDRRFGRFRRLGVGKFVFLRSKFPHNRKNLFLTGIVWKVCDISSCGKEGGENERIKETPFRYDYVGLFGPRRKLKEARKAFD